VGRPVGSAGVETPRILGAPIAAVELGTASLDDLAARCRRDAAVTEDGRRVPDDIVADMRRLGIFALQLPRELGGAEHDPLSFLAVIETLAAADASAGWVAMIGATTNATATCLPEVGAREIFGDAGTIVGGTFNPQGRATLVEGGLRVTGRWPYGSGVEHSDWMAAACLVVGPDGQPALLDGGRPDARFAFFPIADVEVHDTWDTVGMRGTGSHDFSVTDAFVPHRYAMTFDFSAWPAGALWRMPLFTVMLPPMAAVPLGIARAAIDEVVALAPTKVPYRSTRVMAERDMVQVAVARAEALTRSARAFLHDAVGEVWGAAQDGRPVTLDQRAMCRLASVHAARAATEAVGLCFEAAGGSAVHASSALQRQLRDVHTVGQHVVLAASGYETVGRVLLGLAPDTPLL
jgi:alkylation response protein AidB-like acyl-CoA dehydrogenase